MLLSWLPSLGCEYFPVSAVVRRLLLRHKLLGHGAVVAVDYHKEAPNGSALEAVVDVIRLVCCSPLL